MTAVMELTSPACTAGATGGLRAVSPPGVIGAAVVRAGRLAARLTRRRLARAAAVSPATVRELESGTLPLYRVGYRDLCQLAGALASAGAPAAVDIADLTGAAQCDLLISGMLHGCEDYAEVPPIEEPGPHGDPARELLRWAVVGTVPDRFRGLADPSPLLAPADVAALTGLALDMRAGTAGPGLASFGAALLALTER
jgi:transcriptional regulator with XRE-family HTH domain